MRSLSQRNSSTRDIVFRTALPRRDQTIVDVQARAIGNDIRRTRDVHGRRPTINYKSLSHANDRSVDCTHGAGCCRRCKAHVSVFLA